MSPYEIYVENGRVYVQWDSRGPFVVLTPDGIEGEQLSVPSAELVFPYIWGEEW